MPSKHASDLKKTYAKVAPGYEKTHQGDIELVSLQKFASKIPPQSKVLDLGAGNGRDSNWFADQGYQVTMFDLSPEMLSLAKEKVPNAIAIQGDMTEMEFPEESFDGIWARASLLHLTKDEARRVLLEILFILRRSGIFYIRLKKGIGELEVEENKYGEPMTRFFAFYQNDEAEEMLKNTGFEVVEIWESKSKSGQEWMDAIVRKS